MNSVVTKLRSLLQQLTLGSLVKPANLLEEREAFLHPRSQSREKSPVYRYKNSPIKWADFESILPLKSIEAPEEVVEIYQEKQRELDNVTDDINRRFGSQILRRGVNQKSE